MEDEGSPAKGIILGAVLGFILWYVTLCLIFSL